MPLTELTSKDRAFAAAAGISGTPSTTPPATPSRRSSNYETDSTASLELPASAYYIIFVEGCERFCYYGLRAILLLYFMYFLGLNKDSATVGYHLFSSVCYFTPIVGAIISDGFIGRYWTILSLSIVYFFGTVVLSVTAIPQIGAKILTGPIFGLLLIAVGTGGIKPCVSAFGADQISMTNAKQLSRFFAFYYFAINFGSLLSTVLTPLIRSQVHCFGYDCYALAFAVPSLLMLIAIIIFVVGTPLYKRIPPKENIIAKFIAIVSRAIRNIIVGSSSGQKEHWLYRADDKYNNDDIGDVHSVLRVGLLFTPLPIFNALMNQSGSRWTYQASLMDGNLGPLATIQPDQMQALNCLFVLIFIPIFEEVLYPLFARCNLLIRPLQRMFVGMLILVSAFIVAAIVQQAIQKKADAIPVRYNTNIFNGYNCTVMLNYNNITIETGQVGQFPCQKLLKDGLVVTSTCDGISQVYQLTQDESCPSALIVSDTSSGKGIGLTPLTNSILHQRGIQGSALLRLASFDGRQTVVTTVPNKYQYKIEGKLNSTEYQSVLSTEYRIKDVANGEQSKDKFRVYPTAVYTALLYNTIDNQFRVIVFEDVPPFTVHMLWQILQYILLSTAEVLVNITGLMFAYSQAPKRYKTVMTALWLLAVAAGDLIVVLIAETRLVKDQALEFVLFAFFMAFGSFIFGILAIQYKEYKPNNTHSEDHQLIHDKNLSETE
jgi:solute carrier family 15 oligopeptide transporter 1